MSTKCLLKKYKKTVSNDALLKIDEFELEVTNGSKFSFAVSPKTEQFTATLSDGAKFSDDSTQKTYTWHNDLATIVGNGSLKISNKYNIASCILQDGIIGDISVLQCSYFEYINFNNNPQLIGDISKLNTKQDSTSIIECYMTNCIGLYGDAVPLINSINKPRSIVKLQNVNFDININNISNDNIRTFYVIGNPNMVGSIEYLNLPKASGPLYLEGINVSGNISNITYENLPKVETILISTTQCTGSIEGLADNFKSHKEVGSTLAVKCNGIITYQNTPVQNYATITFDGQGGYSVALS